MTLPPSQPPTAISSWPGMGASVCFPIHAGRRLSWLCTGHPGWCEFMSKAILSHSEDTFLTVLLISGSYKLSTTFSLFPALWRRGYDTGVAFMAEFSALDQLLVSVFTTVHSTKAQGLLVRLIIGPSSPEESSGGEVFSGPSPKARLEWNPALPMCFPFPLKRVEIYLCWNARGCHSYLSNWRQNSWKLMFTLW